MEYLTMRLKYEQVFGKMKGIIIVQFIKELSHSQFAYDTLFMSGINGYSKEIWCGFELINKYLRRVDQQGYIVIYIVGAPLVIVTKGN